MRLEGLVAAVHTPFGRDGSLDTAAVETQAEHLVANGVRAAFIAGSTGEGHSLTVAERLGLAERWSRVVRGADLRLIVHVGSNCLEDAKRMAAQAQSLGADATAAFSPSYYKPSTLDALVACCGEIAGAAPDLPFYFYDIPVLTGVNFSMPDFLGLAQEKIPNLAGIKFTNPDLMAYQRCLRFGGGEFDIPWGIDEAMLGALAVGGRGAVGSSFNFAAPIYHRLMAAFAAGDLDAAREEQFRSVRLIETLASFGYLAAAKAVMGFLGVEVGAPRLPNGSLTDARKSELRASLDRLGFFGWIAP